MLRSIEELSVEEAAKILEIPEATVRSYLTAISQGKASQANKLVDPGVTKDAASLLSDDVLGEAKALMKNAKVTKVSARGDERNEGDDCEQRLLHLDTFLRPRISTPEATSS